MDPPEIVALGEKYPGLKKVFETGVEVIFNLLITIFKITVW
jgi:hypothetical protein